jgi:hypothetical protein
MHATKRLRVVGEESYLAGKIACIAEELSYELERFSDANDLILHLNSLPDLTALRGSARDFTANFWKRYAPVVLALPSQDAEGLLPAVQSIQDLDVGIPVLVIAADASLLTVSDSCQAGVEAFLIGVEDVEQRFSPILESVQARLARMLEAIAMAMPV